MTGFGDVSDYLTKKGKLPDNFITKMQAKELGWDPKKGNLDEMLRGKVLAAMFLEIMSDYFHLQKVEFGMRQILIIAEDTEVRKEYYIQMTA